MEWIPVSWKTWLGYGDPPRMCAFCDGSFDKIIRFGTLPTVLDM